MDAKAYTIGGSTITLSFGSVAQSNADVIVSSDDGDISRGGGLSRLIARAAGGPSDGEVRKYTPAKVGDVIVTSAGNLPAKYVFHAITLPGWSQRSISTDVPNGAIVRAAVQKVMQLLPLLGCTSVAFPAIGAGLAGIPFDDVAKEMAEGLVRAVLESTQALKVELYLQDRFGRRTQAELIELFETRIRESLGLVTSRRNDRNVIDVPEAGQLSHPGQPPSAEQRRREISEMLLHLGRQRDRLESDLLASLTASDELAVAKVQRIRTGLQEVARLREIYLHELDPERHHQPSPQPNTVFVSSTYTDLVEYRHKIEEVIRKLELHYVGMEEFTATSELPGEYIRQRVERSEVYLGVLGMRYGSIDPNSGFSMTELEYRQAVASNKPRLMFVMDQKASITLDQLEMSPERFAKLMTFRDRVLRDHVCGMFRDVDDLREQVEKALRTYRAEQ